MRKLIYLFTILTIVSCRVNHNPTEESADIQQKTYVKIESVQTQTKPVPIQAIGRLGSDKEVKLSFKIGGIISAIHADEGDYIKKGKLLATVRTNEIDAQVLKAERVLQKATRDLERIQKMYADSAATLENVQDLTTLVQVSKADVEVAKFNQTYAKIISPVSGRVIRRLAEPNELVAPGQPILMIAGSSGSGYVMKVSLSDKDINRVKYGSTATVKFDAFPSEIFTGKLVNIAESSDPMTGTFEVEVNINAKGKRLRNGYIGQIEISPDANDEYLEVPIQAVVEGDKKEVTIFIPTQSDTIAKKIQVEPFHITNKSIFIKIPKNQVIDKVVTVGTSYLMDGDRIYVK